MNKGILYVVATPIGNLEDISARALRILEEADLVLCEDTRVSRKLFDHHGITTPLQSYHTHSSQAKEDSLIETLLNGGILALISDSGTPTISDPGVHLIARIYEECEEVIIRAVPGPSAVVSALSISGLPASEFLFLGFLPHKKGRETLFKEIAQSRRTVVFYESPHRILKTLDTLLDILDEKRKVVVVRELTKVYEEVVNGSPAEVNKFFKENPEKVRGEFVVVVSGE